MRRKVLRIVAVLVLSTGLLSCAKKEVQETEKKPTGATTEVKLITLDPGHFHAALVQKTMYEQIAPMVHVYGPEGPDVNDHLNRIRGFNTRADNPTSWEEKVHTGDGYLERMLAEKPGNVVVISGNNKKKAQYIKACVDAGLNVLADKPMCIDSTGFRLIEQAFASAEEKGVVLYDIMTERSEISTILQRELVHNKDVFGQLERGSPDNPAVIKESVHHFFKYVAGNPIKRPAWYFDTSQQGEGIVDVTTHLVDLVMWGSFPEQPVDYRSEVEIDRAERWPTVITREQFSRVTRLDDFPPFLKGKLDDRGMLPCYANGAIVFTVRGICAKVSVTWNYEAPEGAKDTHYSMMRGTKAIVSILQGKEQNYRPELYVEAAAGGDRSQLATALQNAAAELANKYPGVQLREEGERWHVLIPDKYRIGHEAHFAQVMERYLNYLAEGELPGWEVPNMIAKYYIATSALEMAKR